MDAPTPPPVQNTAPQVSVVVPARNAASTLARLLRSLVPDRGVIREILLVDDGSVDATAAVAVEISERHGLPLTILPVSFGAAGKSRNFGFAHARGDFLFFIDADDEVFSGSLSLLLSLLLDTPGAGLALGTSVWRTSNLQDKIKIPHGYTEDRTGNVVRFLANELSPIAMGSAMLKTSEATAVRFHETMGLDEDTCFWATLMTKVGVVTTPEPILLYRVDEARMGRRFTARPQSTLLGISSGLRELGRHGVPETALKRRSAWVALRISRQLIQERRYREASRILRFARKHPDYRRSWKVLQYSLRCRFGTFFQSFHGNTPGPSDSRSSVDAASKERRILILTVDPAAPPVSGADLRNFQNALSASKRGACCLVSVRPGDPSAEIPAEEFEVRTAGVSGEASKALTYRRCRVEARIPRAVLARLLAIVSEFNPDTILVEGIPLAALLGHLRPLAECLILDMHNIESDLATRRPAPNSLRKRFSAMLNNDSSRTRKLERKAIGMVDRVWVCSEVDRQRLMKLHRPASPIHVVPNGIPGPALFRDEIPRKISREGEGPVILFVGHLGYWPNVKAAERLATGILPLVRNHCPSALVVLAGRSPAASVRSLAANAGIELHADPPNLSGFYERADLAVVPLFDGGGTRIKILEAMAAGLPVVATALAVEGLDLADGEEILLAETDEGIARHIVELYRNPGAMQRQCLYAGNTVRLRYGTGAIDLAVAEGLA